MEKEYALKVILGKMTIEEVPVMFRQKTSDLIAEQVEILGYAKTKQWEQIKSARDIAETAGLPFKGSVLDYDMRSAFKLEIAQQAAQTIGDTFKIDWTMKDNSVMTLTLEDLISIPLIAAQYSNSLHEKARQYHNQINDAKTVQEAVSVIWE